MTTASAPSPPPPPTASGRPAPSRPARRLCGAARAAARRPAPTRRRCGRISRSANARTVFRSCSRSGVCPDAHASNSSGHVDVSGCAATRRAPWPAGRTGPDRPRPGRGCPRSTKLTARRFGSTCRVTVRSAVSGSSSRSLSTVSVWASHRHCSSVRTHSADVGVAALVAAARAGDHAERARVAVSPKGQRLRQRERRRPAPVRKVSVAGGDLGAGAVGVHGDVGDLVGGDVAGGEHAVHLTVARRRGGGEARIAGQREFDCGRGELASDVGGVGIAYHAPQQRAGRLLGVGVGMVGARQRPLQLGGLDRQRRSRAGGAPARPWPRCPAR